MAIPPERVVLDGPDSVKAHLLGKDCLLDAALEHGVLPLPGGMGQLGFEQDGDFHVPSN